MTSQFITAIGAFVGTFLGIWIAESAGAGMPATHKIGHTSAGFFGTSVQGADLVIPATAGGMSQLTRDVIPRDIDQDTTVSQRFPLHRIGVRDT
jgi:zinc transporter 7